MYLRPMTRVFSLPGKCSPYHENRFARKKCRFRGDKLGDIRGWGRGGFNQENKLVLEVIQQTAPDAQRIASSRRSYEEDRA